MTVKLNIVSDLQKLIGKKYVSGSVFERVAYGQDAIAADLPVENIPIAVTKPNSNEDVSKIFRYANNNKIPVYLHGSGTSFKGAARPKRSESIIVDTGNFDLLEINEDDYYFEVGAGVNQYDLEIFLEKKGFLLPMNVGSKHGSTIGGAVSVNTIGHMVDSCIGKIIDYVMGVEVVLPNGNIIETGTKSIRRPAGIDLTRFFVGSEGLFGLITKMRIRLVPMPKKAYVAGFFSKPEEIAHAFMKIYKDGLPAPLYGELLGQNTAAAAFKERGLGEPPGDLAIATTIAFSQDEANRQANEIVKVFQDQNAIKAYVVESTEEQVALWDARDFITNRLQKQEGQPRKLRAGGFEVGVPLSRLADFFTYIKSGPPGYPALSENEVMFYGHVGASGPHVSWTVPEDTPAEKRIQSIKEARRLEKEFTVKWEGIGGEVGQTASRISAWREKYGEDAYGLLSLLKTTLDPNNILNTGNLEGEGYED
jgi:glycolate oxidase